MCDGAVQFPVHQNFTVQFVWAHRNAFYLGHSFLKIHWLWNLLPLFISLIPAHSHSGFRLLCNHLSFHCTTQKASLRLCELSSFITRRFLSSYRLRLFSYVSRRAEQNKIKCVFFNSNKYIGSFFKTSCICHHPGVTFWLSRVRISWQNMQFPAPFLIFHKQSLESSFFFLFIKILFHRGRPLCVEHFISLICTRGKFLSASLMFIFSQTCAFRHFKRDGLH